MLADYVQEFINDPSAIIDSALSFDGIMGIGAGFSLLLGTTMLTKFTSGGKKNWMSPYEAWKSGLYGDKQKGIILGRYNGSLICSVSSDHIGIDGTTGTGKTATAFLSTLLNNTFYGFMVFDQSGDLWSKTSGRRATYGNVFQLNPGLPNTHCYNPIDDIPNDNRIISNLTAMFEPLFAGSAHDQKQTGGNPFFPNAAKAVLPFMALQVLYGSDKSKKNIGGILEYASTGEACFVDMIRNPKHPKCADIGSEFLEMHETTRTGITANIFQALSLWRDDSICSMTNKSSFSIKDLAISDKPVTVYLTAPATDIKRILPFYVVIEEMLKMHLMNNRGKTLSGEDKVREVCICDDEAQNTKRPSLDSLEISRKFGIRYMLGYQSLYAMGNIYGKDKLGLLRTKVSLKPPPDPDDIYVKQLVSLSGTYKKKVESESSSAGRGGSSNSKTWSIKELPRLTKLDFENWPTFGNGLLTHMRGRPAVIRMFNTEQDKEFAVLIMPAHDIEKTPCINSIWQDLKVTPPDNIEVNDNSDTPDDDHATTHQTTETHDEEDISSTSQDNNRQQPKKRVSF